jgi:ASCH domain-containing protein
MQRWISLVLDNLSERTIDCPDLRRELGLNSRCGIHLAVFVEPYLQLVLSGKKTVESRFSVNRCPPYNAVKRGDLLLLKRSGGPIVGVATVGDVWSYRLDPDSWSLIRDHFADQLCITDPEFWASKQGASYATLMRVEGAAEIDPIPILKRDRRGWVVLRADDQQQELCGPWRLDLSAAER